MGSATDSQLWNQDLAAMNTIHLSFSSVFAFFAFIRGQMWFSSALIRAICGKIAYTFTSTFVLSPASAANSGEGLKPIIPASRFLGNSASDVLYRRTLSL